MMTLTAATRLLFIGDSITASARQDDPEGLGFGYVRMIRDRLAARMSDAASAVTNRGTNSDCIADLERRWQRDVLDRAPDLLSINIGINDVWHTLPPDGPGADLGAFIASYRALLDQTRRALPQTAIVLCEPSVLWLPDRPEANQLVKPVVQLVRVLALQYRALASVPLHDAFERARAAQPDVPWTVDGVHPSAAGDLLIAQTWLSATRLP
jgi:acyl-CoA thioesterase-1